MKAVEEDIKAIAKRYRILSLGKIAKIYSLEEEVQIYEKVAELIFQRYGNIIERQDVIDILASMGHIFTMVVKDREAFYEYKTGNIGISHYLRLSKDLLHELVHKLGYLQEDESFKNMSNVFKEAGTEYVSATTLNSNFSRILIFDNVYAKFPEKTDADFLLVCLTNQINQAIGGQKLEQSILKGRDYFKQAIIDRWGEKYYINLEQNLVDLAREERKYWLSYEYFSEEEKENSESDIKKHIYSIQDTILQAEFNKRFEEIENAEAATTFLKELKEFETNRIRERELVDGEDKYVDHGFLDIFSNYKNSLEEKYGTLPVNFEEDEWSKKFIGRKTEEEVSEEEKREIYLMAIELQNKFRKENVMTRLLRNVFNSQSTLTKGSEEKTIDKPINNYILQSKPLSAADIRKTAKEDRKTEDRNDFE